MRRVMLLAVGMAFALVIVSGVALAKSFTCTSGDCFGTNKNDTIRERQGNGKQDDIHARGGADEVRAQRFSNDTDVLRGQGGGDDLFSRDGDGRDVIICGAGRDTAVIDIDDTVTDGCEVVRVPPGTNSANVTTVTEEEALQLVGQ